MLDFYAGADGTDGTDGAESRAASTKIAKTDFFNNFFLLWQACMQISFSIHDLATLEHWLTRYLSKSTHVDEIHLDLLNICLNVN